MTKAVRSRAEFKLKPIQRANIGYIDRRQQHILYMMAWLSVLRGRQWQTQLSWRCRGARVPEYRKSLAVLGRSSAGSKIMMSLIRGQSSLEDRSNVVMS
jgi:hypothetical protein